MIIFQWTGGTLFSDPIRVNSKDIHLDSGHLDWSGVVFEGEILSKGGYQLILYWVIVLVV